MADTQVNVLVMGGHTTGFHQFSLMGPIYQAFLTAAGFQVTLSEDRDDFLAERLKPFDVIIDYTTGEELTDAQRNGLLGGIIGGKGFVGVHSAADSFKKTEGYISMVGGRFLTHPSFWPKLTINVLDRHHPVTAGIEDFPIEEELYLMETSGHFELLMSTWFDGFVRPITWVKPYGHGRVVYTALGHAQPQTENPNFQRLIVNAVRWSAPRPARG
jgi:hypothetical protein